MSALPQALLAWSSGKDGAWALHVLRQRGEVEVVGLLTTVREEDGAATVHGVPAELLDAQSAAVGLPLWRVPLPTPCPNVVYEERMAAVMDRARGEGIDAVAFGDLHLVDVRHYREERMAGTGITPLFPLWGADTEALAADMIAGGLEAVAVAVDTRALPPSFAGRRWDAAFVADLPGDVDPCGEKGEFHTFCCAGPVFAAPIPVRVTGLYRDDGVAGAWITGADRVGSRARIG